MIEHGTGVIIKHRATGLYLSTSYFYEMMPGRGGCHKPGGAHGNVWSLIGDHKWASGANDRERAIAFLRSREWEPVSEQFDIVPRPCCGCCGLTSISTDLRIMGAVYRCFKHQDSDACAIAGCTRTTKATSLPHDDRWLCGTHWRRFCPPRSARRRAYLAIVRKGKRLDWPNEQRARYWRFWDQLIATARAAHRGDRFDMTEINRMFGWTDGDV